MGPEITIYCVFRGNYDQERIAAIFSTKELAEAYIAKNKAHENKEGFFAFESDAIHDKPFEMILDQEEEEFAELFKK